MNSEIPPSELFERCISFPDIDSSERLKRLIGLEEQITRLTKTLSLLINPASLISWRDKHHPNSDCIVNYVLKRPPLVILAGDVGVGKSELAETIGDKVAREQEISIDLFPMSLSTRGQGRVGEMTQLLSVAFGHAIAEARKKKVDREKMSGAVILLVDEADALTQSRETNQMHHEDRAGVNAFIRGVDRIANEGLPAAVIMCTNRITAIDPAVKRRAADILMFQRPNQTQRLEVLTKPLKQLGFSVEQIGSLVTATGEDGQNSYGFTFSDLTQRLLPAIVLEAYPHNSVTPQHALEIAQAMKPTPPFQENS